MQRHTYNTLIDRLIKKIEEIVGTDNVTIAKELAELKNLKKPDQFQNNVTDDDILAISKKVIVPIVQRKSLERNKRREISEFYKTFAKDYLADDNVDKKVQIEIMDAALKERPAQLRRVAASRAPAAAGASAAAPPDQRTFRDNIDAALSGRGAVQFRKVGASAAAGAAAAAVPVNHLGNIKKCFQHLQGTMNQMIEKIRHDQRNVSAEQVRKIQETLATITTALELLNNKKAFDSQDKEKIRLAAGITLQTFKNLIIKPLIEQLRLLDKTIDEKSEDPKADKELQVLRQQREELANRINPLREMSFSLYADKLNVVLESAPGAPAAAPAAGAAPAARPSTPPEGPSARGSDEIDRDKDKRKPSPPRRS